MLEELLSAWSAWEAPKSKGDPIKAGRMESACQVAANFLGVTSTDFRLALCTYRRRGLTQRQVLNILFSEEVVGTAPRHS